MTLGTNNIYILGAGHFGQRAARLLQKRINKGVITVVDHQPQALAPVNAMGCQTISMDAIAFMVDNVDQIAPKDWIVPAIPIHVAFAWLMAVMKSVSPFKEISVPDSIGIRLPNPVWGDKGQLYASIATFRCPEDCSEPRDLCTFTGKPRPQTLWKTLTDLNLPECRSVCIQSHQLAPGVGGFQFESLQQVRRVIEGNPGKFLISTACKCHGVINALLHGSIQL